MSNGYEHHHQTIQHHQIKTIFLPILCRFSIKDINLNNHYKIPKVPSNDEPSSPKVTCMGQVKRNNRVIAYPATTTTTAIATVNHHKKHTKLQKLFSNKTLLPNTTTSGSKSCITSREIIGATKSVNNSRKLIKAARMVNIGEMDPPLPVVKRVAPPPGVGRDEVNIWRRRFNGEGLKSLQIEQIHLAPINSKFQPPTTV